MAVEPVELAAEQEGRMAQERRQFVQTIARALRSKGHLLTLAQCATQTRLASVERRARERVADEALAGECAVTDIDRGQALWQLLREAIARLRPPGEPEPTPAWRLYAIADGIYVQGKPGQQVAAELGLSPRTFYRARRAAVEAVATVVWQSEESIPTDCASMQ